MGGFNPLPLLSQCLYSRLLLQGFEAGVFLSRKYSYIHEHADSLTHEKSERWVDRYVDRRDKYKHTIYNNRQTYNMFSYVCNYTNICLNIFFIFILTVRAIASSPSIRRKNLLALSRTRKITLARKIHHCHLPTSHPDQNHSPGLIIQSSNQGGTSE